MPMRVPQRAEMAQETPLLGGVEVSPDRLVQGAQRIKHGTLVDPLRIGLT